MSLHLDARQRAMLQEMGVRVWHAPEPSAPAVAVLRGVDKSVRSQAPSAAAAVPHLQPPASAPRLAPARPQPISTPIAPSGWSLLPTRLLYPDANPEHAPAALGAGWLIVTQAVDAREPWAEGAERLLHAMLQALQLHLHPRVALCALQSTALGASGIGTSADIAADIAAQVAAFAPSVVLVMGRSAVRAALGSSEPLAKLREQDLRIAGVPAVATYDAPLLLRNPQGKRSAWADLCRARALSTPPT